MQAQVLGYRHDESRPMSLNPLSDLSAVSPIAADGTRSWEPHHGDSATQVTEEGHLILSVDDVFTQHPGDALTAWATAVDFSLSDIPLVGAETMLVFRTIYQALADVEHDSGLVRAMEAVNEGSSTSLPPRLPSHRGRHLYRRLPHRCLRWAIPPARRLSERHRPATPRRLTSASPVTARGAHWGRGKRPARPNQARTRRVANPCQSDVARIDAARVQR